MAYESERGTPANAQCVCAQSQASLLFDGFYLKVLIGGKVDSAWHARSGLPDDDGWFDYTKEQQGKPDVGPIPEGGYWVTAEANRQRRDCAEQLGELQDHDPLLFFDQHPQQGRLFHPRRGFIRQQGVHRSGERHGLVRCQATAAIRRRGREHGGRRIGCGVCGLLPTLEREVRRGIRRDAVTSGKNGSGQHRFTGIIIVGF